MSQVPPPPPPPPNNPKVIERGPVSEEVARWLGRNMGTVFGWVIGLVFTWALWKVLNL